DAGDDRLLPLVLDAQHRLYLHRHWTQERRVADALLVRAQAAPGIATSESATHGMDSAVLRDALARLFPGRAANDRQQLAAALALLRQLTVISGGPGTGKTTTVARILALLVWCRPTGTPPPVIRLAAPTGKAAARLTQSIREAKQKLRDSVGAAAVVAEVVEAIPEEAATLHRLLGARGGPGITRYAHHGGNPLALDVLVVDEASMLDLGLMAAVLDALPATARLILLGDRDQLASVEAGNVLGDICNHGVTTGWRPALCAQLAALGLDPGIPAPESAPVMSDSLVVLAESHRFRHDSGIGRAALAINAGSFDEPLFAAGDDGVCWQSPPVQALAGHIDTLVERHWQHWRQTEDPVEASRRFDTFRFLCAVREGEFGVGHINRLVEQSLMRRGLIDAGERHYSERHYSQMHYAGRPLLVTRNDYSVRLYNGDVGLVLPDAEAGGALRAFFVQPDGSVRRVALNRLPAHETAYAMTVHKSQGSEFGHIALVLPAQDAPVLTRELVYTGITRARTGVTIWAPRDVLARAISRRVQRTSGLRDALWPAQ
ncbi:MAG: exodeoxyribonuclease V subunit alpha, partial [Gammaproteobacteria bacterium]